MGLQDEGTRVDGEGCTGRETPSRGAWKRWEGKEDARREEGEEERDVGCEVVDVDAISRAVWRARASVVCCTLSTHWRTSASADMPGSH